MNYLLYLVLAIALVAYFVVGILITTYVNLRSDKGSAVVVMLWPLWPIIGIVILLEILRRKNGHNDLGRCSEQRIQKYFNRV